jgi:hypothetical protein
MKKRIHLTVCTKLFTYVKKVNQKEHISGRILNLVEELNALNGAAKQK